MEGQCLEAEVARIQKEECQRGGNSKKNDLDIVGDTKVFYKNNDQGWRGNH